MIPPQTSLGDFFCHPFSRSPGQLSFFLDFFFFPSRTPSLFLSWRVFSLFSTPAVSIFPRGPPRRARSSGPAAPSLAILSSLSFFRGRVCFATLFFFELFVGFFLLFFFFFLTVPCFYQRVALLDFSSQSGLFSVCFCLSPRVFFKRPRSLPPQTVRV